MRKRDDYASSPSAASSAGRSAFLEHGVGIEGLELELLVLDDRDVFAAGLLVGFVLRAGDVDRHRDDDLGMQRDSRRVQAQRLDRLVQDHLAAVDGEAALGDDVGKIARRDRAVELAGVAGRADGNEGLAFELGRDGFGFLLELEVIGFELRALAFELGEIVLRGAQSLFLRQKIVACEAVLDVDDIAHLAEAADTLQKNDLHDVYSFRILRCS